MADDSVLRVLLSQLNNYIRAQTGGYEWVVKGIEGGRRLESVIIYFDAL